MILDMGRVNSIVATQRSLAIDTGDEYHIGLYNGLLMGKCFIDTTYDPRKDYLSKSEIEDLRTGYIKLGVTEHEHSIGAGISRDNKEGDNNSGTGDAICSSTIA